MSRGNAGKGRKAGVPNKYTSAIKDMVVQALNDAGGADYLCRMAKEQPAPFLGLVGRVLPLQVTGEGGGAIVVRWERGESG